MTWISQMTFGNGRGWVSTTWAGDDDTPSAGRDAGHTPRCQLVAWVFGQPESEARAPNRAVLEPLAGRLRLVRRLRAALADLPPVLAVLVCLVGSVIVLAAVLIGLGLLMVHFGAYDRLGHWDERVNQWFAQRRDSLANRLSGDFTLLADTAGIAAVAAVVTVALLLRRWGGVAWLLAAGLAIELTVFLVTNYIVERPRPPVAHLGSTPSTSSWPSGHVAATTVLYGGMAVLVMVATSRRLVRLVAWIVAFALIVCVALSRIYRGDHHPIDTIAGFVLGAAALWAAILVIRVMSSRVGRPARPGTPRSLAGSNRGGP